MLLQTALLGAVIKGHVTTQCKINPARCSRIFHDYNITVTVHLNNTHLANNGSALADVVQQRAALSSLDVVSSCDSIICILCLQMYAQLYMSILHLACMRPCVHGRLLSSLLSPATSNVLRQQYQLSELHGQHFVRH